MNLKKKIFAIFKFFYFLNKNYLKNNLVNL
jgi:hypothetical protein